MRTKLIISALIVTVLAIGCRKNEEVVAPANPVGGKGGNTKLLVSAMHFTKPMDTCMIYIKYDAVSMPAGRVFDDSSMVSNMNGKFQSKFDSLKQGKYFLFAKGYKLNLSNVAYPLDTFWGSTSFSVVDTLRHTYEITINVINREDEIKLNSN